MKWVLATLLVVVAAFAFTTRRVATDHASDTTNAVPVGTATKPENQSRDTTVDSEPADPVAKVEAIAPPCLTLEQLEYHPALVQDLYRFDAVSDSGPTIASYRGLSEQDLLNLTVQGDSAAMVILGAMSIMRAREWPVEKAVPFLLHEEPELMSYRFERPLSAEFRSHMGQARKWFYEAALHGRILALYRVGDALSFEQGGAVELGWIDKQEYEGLSRKEKNALMPANVYNMLAYEIAPELKSGPFGAIAAEFMPSIERQRIIVDGLLTDFSRDLEDAGLPPVLVAESTVPPMEELLLLLCEGEADRLSQKR